MTKIKVKSINGEFSEIFDVCHWTVSEYDVLQVGFEMASGALTTRNFPLRNVLSYDVVDMYEGNVCGGSGSGSVFGAGGNAEGK